MGFNSGFRGLKEKDRQWAYIVTLRRVRFGAVAVDKQ